MLPYRGEFGETLDIERLITGAEPGTTASLLRLLRTDPHLAELDRDLRIADAVHAYNRGAFDATEFLERGRVAIAAYLHRAGPWLRTVFVRDANTARCLEHKLLSLAGALTAVRDGTSPPAPLAASKRVQDLFGRRAQRVPLVPVRAATLLCSDQGMTGRSRYAFRIATPDDEASDSLGIARPDFGRAVFVDDVDVDPRTGAIRCAGNGRRVGHIPTQVLVKGVGPTRYAGNRFSLRANGGLTSLQGERDWVHSETLASGGVPVYRPLELILLPYCQWHPAMGWRPLVVYARLPLENLRVSDLALLPRARRRVAITALRAKLAACAGVSARSIKGADVVRFFVARLGRIAGLCAAGGTFGGRPFFHASLHEQNISLLGELADLGEGRFVNDAAELRASYAASSYVNPERAWPASVRLGTREAACFKHAAHLFAVLAATVLEPEAERPRKELNALFWRGHRDGTDGLPADRVDGLLGAWDNPAPHQ